MLRKRIQLGLIHMALAMTLVPINSTLNRVMIKELALSATLVAILASLPYLFSPIQVAVGSFADRHPVFGYRRMPYIVLGLILCVLGVIISPQVAFLMATDFWAGLALGVVAFGAWGMGFNVATVSYFSLASEVSGEKGRTRTIAIMFTMMVLGIILTAATLSRLLENYSPEVLVQAFYWIGAAAFVLGLIGIIRVEEPHIYSSTKEESLSWKDMYQALLANPQAKLFFIYMILLLAAILGQDVLLEPFGGEAFKMPVNATTRITSIWGGCMLISLMAASFLEKKFTKQTIARFSAYGGMAAFILIAVSGITLQSWLFYAGVVALGLATGLSSASNLSLMLDMTTSENIGLFMGAWGMANALARLTGSISSGVVRDVVLGISGSAMLGYVVVFILDAFLLAISLLLLRRLDIRVFKARAKELTVSERAAALNEVV